MLYRQTLTAIKDLSKDNLSGATEIETKALEALTYFIDHTHDTSLDLFRKQISTLCIEISQVQPSMASLFNLSNDILNISNAKKSINEIKQSLTTYFTHYDCTNTLVRYAWELLSGVSCIVTHSRSSTVLQILKKIGPDIHVICTESRPLNEGRQVANELSSSGIRVTLVVDTAIFSLLQKAQCVLVGADAVTPFGVLNKIGTKGIATAAKEMGIPVYVATSLHKLYPDSLPISLKDKWEVWKNPPEDIEVQNFYFDITPYSQIYRFLTERGVLNHSIITKKIQSIKIAPQLLHSLHQKP